MLASRTGAPADCETLFGDDAEADAIIYCLYADLLAGRVSIADLERVLIASRAYDDDAERILELALIGEHLRQPDLGLDSKPHADLRVPQIGVDQHDVLSVHRERDSQIPSARAITSTSGSMTT